MGLPYVANPGFCKLLTPMGNYAPVRVLSGPFRAPRGHMHYREKSGRRIGQPKIEIGGHPGTQRDHQAPNYGKET